MTGICKLCKKSSVLQDSHFIPAAMYRYVRRANDGQRNPNPTNVTRTATWTTSKQVKDYVLCADCEGLFNKNGENPTLRLVWNGRRFPLGEKLALALEHSRFGNAVAFSGNAIGVSADALGYFALSVIWRGAVHQWNRPSGERSALLNLGAAEAPIRGFLLGKAPFPADVVVLAAACTDPVSQRIFHLPSQALETQFAVFAILTLGIRFLVFTGSGIPPTLRKLCCVKSAANLIFQMDCGDSTLEMYARIVNAR